MSAVTTVEDILLDRMTAKQAEAVKSPERRLLVVAGAGSGKTEVMARRIAWWIKMEGIPRQNIVALTFTERAAEEMKFRIRHWLKKISSAEEEVTLGGMYIGTIHGFCLAKIREYWPDDYHNYDILNESARAALILRGFRHPLGMEDLRNAMRLGQYETVQKFMQAYDQLHEHNRFKVKLPSGKPPYEQGALENDWCKRAKLRTDVGDTSEARAFAVSAARYYAYLRCRRFLDFSTSQSEFIRRLRADTNRLKQLADQKLCLVVDEVQDINPVQHELIELLVGDSGRLTAVGDHRQSIYGFRGAKVEIIGKLWKEFKVASDTKVLDLEENFRSTPRIIDLANRWSQTIGTVRSTTWMKHGRTTRTDDHESHVALVGFGNRAKEALWIAEMIRVLVPDVSKGARHDKRDGSYRGLTLSDVAILVRSSTDIRTYMQALRSIGVPCVVRSGPDLFSQPEVLLFVAALAITAGHEEFVGSPNNPKSLPRRIQSVLGCVPRTETVLREAAKAVRREGLAFDRDAEERLLTAAKAIYTIYKRISEDQGITRLSVIRTPQLRHFLSSRNKLRRVFPQKIFHMLLSEAKIDAWDTSDRRGQTAMFHLGALSGLITDIETPGWTSVRDYPWQIVGLCQFGAEQGRTDEQPLMEQPDAVSISTIHAAKGLEFAAVFLADVNPCRFPSSYARKTPKLPLSGKIEEQIDISGLADNANYDGERRLLYVALTRAERFLFISHSGQRTSRFVKELQGMVKAAGGLVPVKPKKLLKGLKYAPQEYRRDVRIVTSFSDLRYYLECPHDFYLRKVLGFSPTIDQAFGYGRGVHNLMRAIHSDPKKWAALAHDREALEHDIRSLIRRGLFYLRYTTGEPVDNMRRKGIRIVADYVQRYASELATLIFEPEKEFESLIEYEDGGGSALVSGAVDLVRQDQPPRVTLIDFKSGDPDSDLHQKLDEKEMQLQVGLYAVAVKKELQYQPDQGLVRYLDADDPSKAELRIPLDEKALDSAKNTVVEAAKHIRDRGFDAGPTSAPKNPRNKIRCAECDFGGFCGMKAARNHRATRASD